jgi:hypothetical protein
LGLGLVFGFLGFWGLDSDLVFVFFGVFGFGLGLGLVFWGFLSLGLVFVFFGFLGLGLGRDPDPSFFGVKRLSELNQFSSKLNQ